MNRYRYFIAYKTRSAIGNITIKCEHKIANLGKIISALRVETGCDDLVVTNIQLLRRV
jgi:hypothetical protein